MNNKRTTQQAIAEQQALNRKMWAKENDRLHYIDANKLIAEFMGYEINYRPNSSGFIEISDTELCDVDDLKYHKSWDCLMPVIENIDHLQHKSVMSIEKALSTRSIDDTYKAVVEFIKENETIKVKFEITEQDYRDIQTIYNGLSQASWYIEEIVGTSNLEQHHEDMLDSIDVAQEWLNKIKNN